MEVVFNILCGIIASIIFKWLEYVFSKNSTESSPGRAPVTFSSIEKLKKQFYFCFPVGLASLCLSFKFHYNDFIWSFLIICTTFMLLLSLFAFMCAIEALYKVANNDPNNNPKDSPN